VVPLPVEDSDVKGLNQPMLPDIARTRTGLWLGTQSTRSQGGLVVECGRHLPQPQLHGGWASIAQGLAASGTHVGARKPSLTLVHGLLSGDMMGDRVTPRVESRPLILLRPTSLEAWRQGPFRSWPRSVHRSVGQARRREVIS